MIHQNKSSFSGIVRADNWVYSKIPPLLAVGYGMALVTGTEFLLALKTLSLIFVCICSVAAYGHIINDIFDIQQDLSTGKKNSMAGISPIWRLCSCLLFIATGFGPLFILNSGLVATILLIINYLLPTIYSIPHVRLKERGFAGVIADALGAHAVPTLFIAISVIHLSPTPGNLCLAVAVSAAIWAFFAGLRGIIIHQISDRLNDKRMNVVTFVGSRRRRRLRTLVLRFFVPFEIMGLICFLGIILPFSPILVAFVLVYIISEFAKVRCGWKLPLFYPEHPTTELYLPLLNNEFYEVWLPCALVGQLVFEELGYVILLILHIVLFKAIIKERLVILGRLIRDLCRFVRTRII